MPLSVITNLRGEPEVPSDVARRLAAVDAGLSLRWTAQGKVWALVRQWPETDRRWQWVRESRYNPSQAHDIIGYIPNDCAVDQVPSYVTRLLREWPVADARKVLDGMERYNQRTDAVEEAVAEATEAVLEEVTAPLRKRGRPRKSEN